VSWHDELMATCRAESLTTGNVSRRLAAVHRVLRSIVWTGRGNDPICGLRILAAPTCYTL